MKIKKEDKKGYYFSVDAFIALIIILGVVLFIKPHSTEVVQEVSVQQDLLSVLSTLQIGEIDNAFVDSLILSGNITNLNQSVLEQIGEFYATSNPNAGLLTQSILDDLDLDENIGLYFNNQEIATSGSVAFGNSESVWTSRQVISGISDVGSSAQGFSSRAFIFSENNVDYVYFGGYVGDGNITVSLGKDVIFAKVEAVFNKGFNLSVNGLPTTDYAPVAGVPFEFNLSSGFVAGDNFLYFTSDENLYVAGGFVKVFYNSSNPPDNSDKFHFPGINGFINIYDSFFIPGILNNMEIFLNFSSAFDIFLTIGNKTIYQDNGTNMEFTLTNATLGGLLDYSTMNYKTIPLRLGIDNVSYLFNISQDADVFSVSDLSTSMNWRCSVGGNFCSSFQWGCENWCRGTWEPMTPLDSAKDANKVFIDSVIEGGEDNRVGLIGYSQSVDPGDYHPLSRDNTSLKAEVDSWNAGGFTCICCGINDGINKLNAESSPFNFRSMVVMSDGEANVECPQQNTGDPKQDAIQAACDAASQGMYVYAVAFGGRANVTTLQSIASCGQGSFFFGDIDDLVQIYQDIAQEILNAAYYEQTVVGEGFSTYLDSSSYVSVDYDRTIPYGLIINAETPIFGSSAPIGNFTLPSDATPHEVNVVSYSGSRWTSKVDVFNNNTGLWESIFDLSEYGVKYVDIGDPYVVNIPISNVRKGNNSVNVSLGLGPNNLSDGSQYNKILYSVIKNVSGFSPILPSADGCIWEIEFEDDSIEVLTVPNTYTGSERCYYNSTILDSSHAIYNPNDAIDVSIFNLLSSLDLNLNGKAETKFTENDLTISASSVDGIPFVWESEVQVRVWQ